MIPPLASKLLISAGIVLLVIAPAMADEGLECPIDPIDQEFRWSRKFQGIDEPVSWTVNRHITFESTGQQGRYRALETLVWELPEFRWRFQQYLGSARVDSCELRFDVLARTPTTTADSLEIPLVVRYQRARCKASDLDCVESADLIGECDRQKRSLRVEERAEIDATYRFGFLPRELRAQVAMDHKLVYGALDRTEAQALLTQVLDAGADTLKLLTSTIGDVSLARLTPDMQPADVSGGFSSNTGSRFELNNEYLISARQVCRARLAIDSFGNRHRATP